MNAGVTADSSWYQKHRTKPVGRVWAARGGRRWVGVVIAAATAVVTVLATAPGAAALPGPYVDPVAEAQNLLIWGETTGSTLVNLDPNFYKGLAERTYDYQVQRLDTMRRDPERSPNPNTCTLVITCPINPDVAIDKWRAGGGLVEPALFTNRTGATLSAHVWAYGNATEQRPAVVFTNGSVAGYEQAYWFMAQHLARAGYLVVTYDIQGEGMSDQFGEAPDQLESAFAGIPLLGLAGPQSVTGAIINGTQRPVGDGLGLGGNGLPFIDGQTDAVDFLVSTPSAPYKPRPSRTTGTSHDSKHQRRVAAGLVNGYNPLWNLWDPNTKIGAMGHSYGAIAASWSGQEDSRIGSVVAWDSLCVPGQPTDEVLSFASAAVNNFGPFTLPAAYGFSDKCFGTPTGPVPKVTKPGLMLTGDYLIAPVPYVAAPDPRNKTLASYHYSEQGVDTGAVIIRGGNHYDYVDGFGLVPSSLRGQAMAAWYTQAWFDKYLRNDPSADARLIDAPWSNDAATMGVDPSGDPNMFSYHYLSRMDIELANGQQYRCENLRHSCK